MRLILSRHGNTFGPGETALWVGGTNDLPLVESGRLQAEACAAAFAAAGVAPARILAAPLLRTAEYGRIVARGLGLDPAIVETDARLREIDYGLWAMKSNDEIAARWGHEALTAWQEHGLRPEGAGFAPPEAEQEEGITTLFAALAGETPPGAAVLAISSNGVLRHALALDPAALAARRALKGGLKVGTGQLCRLDHGPAGWRLAWWNLAPAHAQAMLG